MRCLTVEKRVSWSCIYTAIVSDDRRILRKIRLILQVLASYTETGWILDLDRYNLKTLKYDRYND